MSVTGRFIYRTAAVREADRIAITECGIPGQVLMCRAAEATVRVARQMYPDAHRWLVLCGAGNNAGDGYMIARLAAGAGFEVRVAALSDPVRLTGDAALAWQAFRDQGGSVMPFTAGLLQDCDLVIDALLGSGLGRPLEGAWLYAVESVNAARLPVISVDIPSGLDGDNGAVRGAAIRAMATVTFVGHKLGLFTGHGPDCRGHLHFDDLGVPESVWSQVTPCLRRFTPADLAVLPPRAASGHKGLYGHVLVVGGNHGMGGAVRLAGEAALRSGAGLVSVATRAAHTGAMHAGRPELMCHAPASTDELDGLLRRASVVALGPGLGGDAWARQLWEAVINGGRPKIVDADALNLLARTPCRHDDWILTPHPGEAARLLGTTAADVQGDRLAALDALCTCYGGTVVLKGAGTLIGREGEIPWLIDRGNPGMATAGMGDLLTGVTAGLVAQTGRLDPTIAAAAAFVHAAAGDDAAIAGPRGLIASDLLPHIRAWLNTGQ